MSALLVAPVATAQTPSNPAVPPAAPPAEAPPAEAPSANSGAPTEIIVRDLSTSDPTVEHRLQQRELRGVPGTMGDAMRAVQSLPGVAHTPSLSGLLVVRGTPAESTQVFIQGSPAPLIYHFGGLSSVIPTEVLESIRFQPGNFEAAYGRGLGGVVDARLRRSRSDGKYHVTAQVDFVDARAIVEGPVPGSDWRFLAGVRRSYFDAWLGPLLDGTNNRFERLPVYYDYQLFLEHELGHNGYVRLGVYGSDDHLDLKSDSQVFFSRLQQNVRFFNVFGEARLQLGAHSWWHHTLSLGRSFQDQSTGATSSANERFPMTMRGELAHAVSDTLVLRGGPDLLYAPFRLSSLGPEQSAPGDPFTPPALGQPPRLTESRSATLRPAIFAQADYSPTDRWRFSLGGRLDYTHETERWDISPRLSAAWDVHSATPRTTLKASGGLYYEPPDVRLTLPELSATLRSARAAQVSLGLEQELGERVEAQLETFAYKLDHLPSQGSDEKGLPVAGNDTEGNIHGLELMLRYRADAHFFGWLSYTLSRSTRRYAADAPAELFAQDQTHVLSVLGSYRLGAGWQVGARFRAASGSPRGVCEQTIVRNLDGAALCLNGAGRSERGPWFHQLDLRLEKEWRLSASARLSGYLDLINVYNREQSDLPFLPTLGVRGEL